MQKKRQANNPFALGYFLAGGVAGMISRTSTAPLDRLKVYLIAQTGNTSKAVQAAKQGAALQATKHAARPLIDACKELWAAGGIRSLFAGTFWVTSAAVSSADFTKVMALMLRRSSRNLPSNLDPTRSVPTRLSAALTSNVCRRRRSSWPLSRVMVMQATSLHGHNLWLVAWVASFPSLCLPLHNITIPSDIIDADLRSTPSTRSNCTSDFLASPAYTNMP